MVRKMLIDATQPKETRVAVVDNNLLMDYDAESPTKQQVKGNIYLAKVIRVEPSLQAAFVEYGNNRHGFLPFSEIHPDYYNIPVSDRRREEEPLEPPLAQEERLPELPLTSEVPLSFDNDMQESENGLEQNLADELSLEGSQENITEEENQGRYKRFRYKIQEVIKRRQIMLVQVVKEERGNKGAALTTYLSLPGRYCVLMPNAGHRTGGISRKIADTVDRKRLKTILDDLPIPEGINLIVRTAGQDRNKVEIRRDYEYLIRLWAEIREKTLSSLAPSLVYAEGDLIKRSIRDNYTKEVEEIIVEGEEAYKTARAFMKNLIPSHVKRIKLYKEPLPLFQSYKIESQIDAIMSPVASLPSGGSIVINTTEALVAIDVNSGKSTKERHIDATALKTNLEAADEVARQMRLRDLSGIVVIDFIDMADPKDVQAVEKRFREAIKSDRARIQTARISQFGLLELSRQRLRPSIVEFNMRSCSHCNGTGLVRSIESAALLILRAIEIIGIEGRSAEIVVTVPSGIDLYLLNQKRANILHLETRYGMQIQIQRDDSLVPPDYRLDILVSRESLPTSSSRDIQNKEPSKILEAPKGGESKKGPRAAKTAETNLLPSPIGLSEPPTAQENHSSNRTRKNPYQNWRRNRQNRRQDFSPEEKATPKEEIIEPTLEASSPIEGGVSSSPDTKENPAKKRNRRPNRQRSNNRKQESAEENVLPTEVSSPSPVPANLKGEKGKENKTSKKKQDPFHNEKGNNSSITPEEKKDSVSSFAKEEKKEVGTLTPGPSSKETPKPQETEEVSPETLLMKKKRRGFWSRLLDS